MTEHHEHDDLPVDEFSDLAATLEDALNRPGDPEAPSVDMAGRDLIALVREYMGGDR
jgi:hypothetical protein